VELDALPVPVLREKVRRSIETSLDMEALRRLWDLEYEEQHQLAKMLQGR
jgi:hypothetical protein